MSKGSSPPPAPDPMATARAQALANKEAVLESARVNQINEMNPYGSVTYTGVLGEPDRTRITSLSPAGEAQLEQRNQLAALLGNQAIGRANQIPSAPFEISGNMPRVSDFDVSDIEQREYQRALDLMQPELARQERRFETTMANRGLPIGAEAYSDARSQFDRSRDELLRDAAYDAMRAAQNEQSRRYGLARTERGDLINEQLLSRTQPMNELAAILQGSPAFQTPQFGSTAQYQISPADIMGATYNKYQGDLNAWNARQSSRNALLGGLASLGGAVMTGGIPFF